MLYIIGGIVGVIVLFILVMMWCCLKVASDADDAAGLG